MSINSPDYKDQFKQDLIANNIEHCAKKLQETLRNIPTEELSACLENLVHQPEQAYTELNKILFDENNYADGELTYQDITRAYNTMTKNIIIPNGT